MLIRCILERPHQSFHEWMLGMTRHAHVQPSSPIKKWINKRIELPEGNETRCHRTLKWPERHWKERTGQNQTGNSIRAKPNQHKCTNNIIQFTEDTTHLQPSITTPKWKVVLKRKQIIGVHLLVAYLYNAVLRDHSFILKKAIKLIEL